jgi:diguanylate cyclase (GGDEF)-like protein
VARRLTATVRAVDTVARLGGDEFAVVVRGVADVATARGIAGKIVEALRQPFFIDGTECSIGCSVGIALYPEHGSEVNTLLSDADEAMYLAKRGGGNRDCVYGAAAAPAGVGA